VQQELVEMFKKLIIDWGGTEFEKVEGKFTPDYFFSFQGNRCWAYEQKNGGLEVVGTQALADTWSHLMQTAITEVQENQE